ncbi:MAG TPA: ABC transporter ATP-binding protein [Conexibacter sp.]|nr:ABC transporter ATP-binding protein [Conexibacter sp.]
MSAPRLAVRAVVKHYDTGAEIVRAVDGVTFHIDPGETVVLSGPSGSGKSTLLMLAAGVSRPNAGEIVFDGGPLPNGTAAAAARWRRRQVGFVTQKPRLTPATTAVENAAIKLMLDGVDRREARRLATRMLEDVGLGDRISHEPHRLSGGEQQRVAIARALVNEPPLILADEPTAHLDATRGEQILDLLATFARTRNAGLLLVSHDALAERVADRVLHLRDGRLEP